MTAKSEMTALRTELNELKRAMAEAQAAAGGTPCVIINDPEDPELLRDYVIPSLDQTQTVVIGVFPQPGTE
jgi:hypothetical protein